MKLLFYRIKKLLSIKETIISLIALTIAASSGIAAFSFLEKEVDVYIGSEHVNVKTLGSTIEDALRSGDIEIGEYDYISKELDEKLGSGAVNAIYIKRAIPIAINYGGENFEVYTIRDYVYEVFEDNDFIVDDNDTLNNAELADEVYENMQIEIVKVDERIEISQEDIPYDVVASDNKYMDEGDVEITSLGETGLIEYAYNCVYENGELVSKENVYEETLKEPVTQYEDHGIIKTYVTDSGYTIRYTDIVEVRMTAYTASYRDTGKSPGHPEFGITYTGRYVERGIVAVDPRYIPLETKMYVEIDGGVEDYGFALAADTGGAIKEDLIDLYFNTQEFVDRWGTKWGRVYILAEDDPNIEMKVPD